MWGDFGTDGMQDNSDGSDNPDYSDNSDGAEDTVVWRDTVWVKDSVAVWQKGDTVYRERWRTKYADRYVYKVLQDTMIKTDTVRVSYPVVKTLTKWEKAKDKYFLPSICVCGVLFVSLLWLIKRKV